MATTAIHQKLLELSLADLNQIAKKAIPNGYSPEIGIFMAMELLSQVFGKEWLNQKLFTRETKEMLLQDGHDFRDEAKFMNLVQMLGEGLFNLRCIKGFQNVVDKMASDNIGSALAEIESGRLLRHRGVSFHFVDRMGQRRKDFDITIRDQGLEISCETKCKMEGVKFSTKTFQDDLTQAKKQLPLNKPSLVLIKVPADWSKNEKDLEETALKLVQKTKRPFGVVCWREVWTIRNGDEQAKYIKGFEAHNDSGFACYGKLHPFLPTNGRDRNWTEFSLFDSFLKTIQVAAK